MIALFGIYSEQEKGRWGQCYGVLFSLAALFLSLLSPLFPSGENAFSKGSLLAAI